MHRLQVILVLAAALFIPSSWVSAQESVESRLETLIARADPTADEWDSEAFQARAARVLAQLGKVLGNGEDISGLVADGARATELRPAKLHRRRIAGGLEVLSPNVVSGDAALSVPEALDELTAPLVAGDRRFKFKIVGVSGAGGEQDLWRTRVRYESAARLADGVVQQTAYWNVTWASQGLDGQLGIAQIDLESFEELRRDGFVLSDATAAVLPPGDAWNQQLALGGEYWYGRIDAIGELNLLGHQGIAVGDFDGDGLEDLYVAMGSGLPNRLLVQSADGTARDVAVEAGVAWLDDSKGTLFADMDNDGDQDLLIAIGPTIVVAKNDGKGKFEGFVSMRAPTDSAFYSLSVADYDLDGDLDIYGCRYVKVQYGVSVPMPFHDAQNGPTNHLMRNDGDNRFTDVTNAVGLGVNNSRFSLVGSWADYDGDGDPDLYVANDFGRNNLYRNDGGTFVDVAAEAGVEDQAAGMGVSWSDYDGDGDLDLYVTNMFSAAGNRVAYQPRFKSGSGEQVREQIRHHALGNSLLANQGDGTFRDVSDDAGVRMGRWGWGASFADLNNDGFEDIVVPNGFLTGAIEDDL